MDVIVRTVKGNPGLVLGTANKLHPNLQFKIEEIDSNGNLAFLDLNVNVDSGKKVTCGSTKNPLIPVPFQISEIAHLCSTKETSLMGRFLGFSDVLQHRKILTRHWKKNRKQWIENQYPKNWSDRVVLETLKKIIGGKKNLEVKVSEPRNDKWLKDLSPPPLSQCNIDAIHLNC